MKLIDGPYDGEVLPAGFLRHAPARLAFQDEVYVEGVRSLLTHTYEIALRRTPGGEEWCAHYRGARVLAYAEVAE